MTEPEAINLLFDELTTDTGFIAQLQRGEGLDREAVRRVREALDVLTNAWAGRQYVPKRAALALMDVFTPLYESAEHNPEQAEEIRDLARQLIDEVGRPFYTPPLNLSEEEAIGIIYGNFGALPPADAVLRYRQPALFLTDFDVERMQQAFDALAHYWADRPEVPKKVVSMLIDIRDQFRVESEHYTTEDVARFQRIGDDLAERAKNCLR